MKRGNIQEVNTMTDERDGRTYRTVKIGSQVWMAENLSFTIDNAIGCCYENDEKYKEYGRLYDWVEAMSIAPEGWHLPTKEEWQTLFDLVEIDSSSNKIDGSTAGKYLKAKAGWNDYLGQSGNGTDEFGFSALPGGGGFSDGSFLDVGYYGNWWSASEGNSDYAYCHFMDYNDAVKWYSSNKSSLYSVRCVKDKS